MNVVTVFIVAFAIIFTIGLGLWALSSVIGTPAVAILFVIAATIAGAAAVIEYITSEREKP